MEFGEREGGGTDINLAYFLYFEIFVYSLTFCLKKIKRFLFNTIESVSIEFVEIEESFARQVSLQTYHIAAAIALVLQ